MIVWLTFDFCSWSQRYWKEVPSGMSSPSWIPMTWDCMSSYWSFLIRKRISFTRIEVYKYLEKNCDLERVYSLRPSLGPSHHFLMSHWKEINWLVRLMRRIWVLGALHEHHLLFRKPLQIFLGYAKKNS